MLYHKKSGIPPKIQSKIRRSGIVRPVYSDHARNKSAQRGIELPQTIDFAKCRPFEIEAKRDGTIIKVAYRYVYPNDKRHDLVLVIHPRDNFVRTIWLNAINDKHATLDMSKYELIHQ